MPSRLIPPLRNGIFVAHAFTTAVMVGLTAISALVSLAPKRIPPFVWYAENWPFASGYWAMLLGLIAIVGGLGCAAMLGCFRTNKYLILAASTVVAAGHLWVAQTIWTAYHFATGTTTYPLIFLLSAWVFWRVSEEYA